MAAALNTAGSKVGVGTGVAAALIAFGSKVGVGTGVAAALLSAAASGIVIGAGTAAAL